MSLSFNKTRLGFDPLDKALGGIYFNHPTLVNGPRNSGKSLLSAQFAAKVLQTGERVCVMVESNPNDFFLDLQSVNVDVGAAVGSGQLLALSCKNFADTQATAGSATLPFPAALEELRELTTSKSIPFFIFNTVLPWVAVPLAEMPARVEEFTSATETMGITSLLLLPRPASPAAVRLRDTLAERCPIGLQLVQGDGVRHIRVTRYRGATDISLPADYPVAILPGRGFVAQEEADGTSLASQQIPSLAPRPQQRSHHHHHALLSPTVAGAPPPPHATTPAAFPPVNPSNVSSASIPHPHRSIRHHALLPPGALPPPEQTPPEQTPPEQAQPEQAPEEAASQGGKSEPPPPPPEAETAPNASEPKVSRSIHRFSSIIH